MHSIINTYLCVLILFSLFLSCNRGHENYEIVQHPDISKQQCDTLTYHLIPLNIDNTLTQKFIMVNDSIAINSKVQKAGNFIDIININTGNTISKFFNLGEGPDEMLFCAIYTDGHMFTAVDYMRNRFCQFPIDSFNNASFHPEFINYPYTIGITSSPVRIKDSILIINPFHYINETSRIYQNKPRFFKTALDKQTLMDIGDIEYYTQNVGQSNILINHDSGDIWLLPLNKSEIEIYDSSLTHKKTIIIPSEISDDPELIVKETSTGKDVSYKGGYPLGFTGAVTSPDNKTIYLSFIGKFIGSNDRDKNHGTYIFVMGWDGNLLKTLWSPRYIHSLSAIGSELYATIEDDEENRILIRFDYETN